MDPLTLSAIGGTILVEGIKFLYGQAGELLKSWRERRQKGDAAEPPRLGSPPPNLLEGNVSPAVANLDVVNRFEGLARNHAKRGVRMRGTACGRALGDSGATG